MIHFGKRKYLQFPVLTVSEILAAVAPHGVDEDCCHECSATWTPTGLEHESDCPGVARVAKVEALIQSTMPKGKEVSKWGSR